MNAERIVLSANPNANDSSPYAIEGTIAHELCEKLLLNPDLPHEGDEIDTMEDVDMLRHCLRYREYCQNVGGKSAMCFVEERVRMPQIHPKAFGTADYIAYIPEYDHLHVIDFKYGAGQYVDVVKNPQAMMYAEGARQMMWDNHKINPKYFTAHIFQPRLMQGANIAYYQFRNTELADFVAEYHDAARRTITDIDSFNPGDKQCHWCLANPCKARQAQMDSYFAGEFDDLDDAVETLSDDSPLMSDDELSQWLMKAASLKKFISKIESIAYERAMDRTPVPGFKLVEGRGSYKPNLDALEFILGDDIYAEPKPRSMTELKKHLGTREFEKIKQYYKRVPGKPALVIDDDPRQVWSQNKDLDSMFDDL